ncbi:MAG: CvpA family protein [Planctomycetota bacterium]|jgi:uncharacterized membrane protein required for colicin V production
MSILLSFLLLVVLGGCVAFLYADGMWSNAIQLVNVIFAGLLAMSFWEPLARWIESWGSWFASCTVFWDITCLWLVFCAALITLRSLTSFASKVRVRFLKIADLIGGFFFSFLIGYVMVCFTLMTLHTAPLQKNFMNGAFKPDGKMLFSFLAPDQHWLKFTQAVTNGSLCRGTSDDEAREYGGDTAVFDKGSRFIKLYSARRVLVEGLVTATGSLRTPATPKPR